MKSSPIDLCRIKEISDERQRFGDVASGFPFVSRFATYPKVIKMALVPIDFGDLQGDANFKSRVQSQMQLMSDWYGQASGGGADGSSGGSGREDAVKKDAAKGGSQSSEEQKSGAPGSKKSQGDGAARALEAEQRRDGAFDWWMLIKVLIVFLILALVVLIALSNLKKR